MQKMIWTTYDAADNEIEIACEIVEGSEFYEPGDPVPGYSIRLEDGTIRGSIDGRALHPAKEA